MGEILGLGVTHYPPLAGPDAGMAGILRAVLADPGLPARLREPSGWPEPLRQEYGEDQGVAAAARHRSALVDHFREARRALDDFRPDVVIVWGDDQYENFREDIVPSFCVLACEAFEARPWDSSVWYRQGGNVWSEPADTVLRVRGHRPAAKHLVRGLLEHGVDVAYAYRPLHHPGLAHAFLNTVLFLDWDRQGFPYPLIPVAVNCYGRRVLAHQGGRRGLDVPLDEAQLDPPSPMPRRCMEVGATTARVMLGSPWRAALVASSSWSHAFLVDKHHHLHPDHAADRRLFAALRAADWATWRRTPLAAVEDAGQQEVLNWFCLAGAMEALGRAPAACALVESWAFNSNKAFAIFPP